MVQALEIPQSFYGEVRYGINPLVTLWGTGATERSDQLVNP